MAKAALARAPPLPTCRPPFQQTGQAGACKSVVTPSTTAPSRSPKKCMPTVIDVLETVDFHAEELRVDDFVFQGLQRRDVRRGRWPTRRHRLRRLCGGSNRQALERAPFAGRHRRGHLRCAGRCGVRWFCGPLQHADRALIVTANDFRLHLRHEPHRASHRCQSRKTTTCAWAA